MPRGPRGEKRAIMSVWDDFIHRLEQDLAECRRYLECSIASAGMAAPGSTQLNGKSIGTRKRLACTRVSYANFARNTENSQMASEPAFGRQRSWRGCYIVTVSDRTLSYGLQVAFNRVKS